MKHIWETPYWPNFGYDHAATETALAQAVAMIGETSGLIAGLSKADQEHLQLSQIVREAMASFGIEGVTLDEAQIEASVIASLKHRNQGPVGHRSDAVARLMLSARETRGPLVAETLFDWHRLLFFGIEVEDLGRWRSFEIEIVRSASAGSHEVLYKAPPPADVPSEMDRFFEWLNTELGLPVSVRAALAHLWFESIHPFSDGNGRIGRALIEYVFACEHPLPFSFSRQVEADKKAYYAALQAGRREGRGMVDATAFVLWFLQTLVSAASGAREEAIFLVRRNQFFLAHAKDLSVREEKVLRKLFDQGAERLAQGLSARSYCKIANVSSATATRDLLALEQRGILQRSTAAGRSTVYQLVL